jgi:CheY-like chemotaxis protein
VSRILIAEDETRIASFIQRGLRSAGFAPTVVGDGRAALDYAMTGEFDLLVLDLGLPGMDGFMVLRRLRESRNEIPVLILTARDSVTDTVAGLEGGADDYVTKPFRFEELDLRVKRTLQRSHLAEQMARERLGAAALPERPASESEVAAPPSGLAGRLQEVGLPGLLTLLEMERKSGVLVVIRDEGSPAPEATGAATVARVFLVEGRVHAARLDGQDEPANAECVYGLLEWRAGRFEFEASELDMENEVRSSTSFLLMEAARRLDERDVG